MKVTFETTEDDFETYNRWCYFYRNLGTRLTISILISLWVGASSISRHASFNWPSFLSVTIFTFLLIVALGAGLPSIISLRRFRKKLATLEFPLQFTIEVFSEGINVEGKSTNFFKWSDIKNVSNMPSHIAIQLINGLYVIPKQYFHDNEQISIFFNKLNVGYSHFKVLNPKPSYSIGLLGFIPIIGFVNGIIMVVKGISKYKDTKYILIGVAGILFTVSIYGFLIYQATSGTLFNDSELKMTQGNLNDLVEKIEFYKLQNNRYPDSLKQVNESGMTFMYETMNHSFSSKKAVLFNYKRIGNKYTLFSSGFDGIPNTKDDVYPTINVADTSKFGLMRQ